MNIIERLFEAINAHDLDALVECFAVDVESMQPAHPARAFRGREQIRANWAEIFAGIPDLQAELLDNVIDRDRAWSEWSWSGTRRDGYPFEMRGVTVQRIAGGVITSLHFYMEPVDRSGHGVMHAIREVVA